jgi:hypothetical protein
MNKKAIFTTTQSLNFGKTISHARAQNIWNAAKRVEGVALANKSLNTAYKAQVGREMVQGFMKKQLGNPTAGPLSNYSSQEVEKFLFKGSSLKELGF